jgi:DNA-binding beta-propeller fold protein YncE
MLLLLIGGLLLLLSAFGPVGGAQAARSIGDTRVFATVPDPGQPAGIAMDGRQVLVSTAGLLQFTNVPRLFVYDQSGGLVASHAIPPMNPQGMALMGVAADAAGRAYVVDMNGRIVRIDPASGAQDVYATFPGSFGGLTTMPFDIVFDRNGFAYVTDQNLAAIWRIPPGGGTPQLWFQDPRLFGYLFGAAGIRVDPAGKHLYFSVAVSEYPTTPAAGMVYRLPLVDHPSAAQLQEVFRYPPRSMPFGIAFGATGKLYVALAGANQISILQPDPTAAMQEQSRFPSAAENARRSVPYDNPLGLAFNGRGALLVTNSNVFAVPDASHWAVLDAFVADKGAPLATPAIPGGP